MAVVTLSLIANVVAGARQANAAAPNAGSIADPNSAPAASTDIAGQTASAAHSATATTSSAPPTDQKAALTALHGHWNDWAAHYNIAAAQIQDGNWNYAVAHAAAAFLLHPSDANNRDNLRYAIQQAGTMDPTLRRLLYGAWFQQLPGLLSSAGWQRLALAASLLLAAGLTAIVFGLYVPGDSWVTAGNRGERDIRSALRIHWPRDGRRALKFASRSAAAVGLLVFLLAVTAFNAYGVLSQPNAGILLAGVNVSPSPTELVPEQETFPTTAGSVVVTRHAFLGWHQISAGANISGWIRGNAVMPFYAASRH
jgi:hypothetical protein